jgi:type I restriction enzyme, S subunit
VMEAGELPDGWSKATVGEVATLLRGVTYSKDQASNSPQIGMKPILRGNNINGELNFDDLVYVPEALIAPEQVISAGDIIFAMSSGSKHLVGKSAKARISFDGGFGAFCGLLRATEAINKDFLHYVFQGSDFRRAISEVSKGSNINNLKREHILDFEFSCPPLAEQHRIVAKVEELFSELEQGVASLKTAREQLKVYRQSLLKNAFEGKLTAAWRAAHRDQLETAAALQQRIAHERQARYQKQLADWQTAGQPGPKPKSPKPLPPLTAEELAELPELPEGWGWIRVGELVDRVTVGYVGPMKDEYIEQGVPFLRSQNVRENRFDPEGLKFVSEGFHQSLSKSALSAGDVVVVRSGSIGVSCVIPEHLGEANCSDLVIVKMPRHVSSYLLAYYMNWQTQGRVKQKMVGVALIHFNTKSVEGFAYPLCSEQEQQQIEKLLAEKLSEADQLDQTLATALQQAAVLRQSILKKAFHGQLEKQDKNEEPATALLERIRAGKSNGMDTPRNRRKLG